MNEWQNWTACEEHGHNFENGWCRDCGEYTEEPIMTADTTTITTGITTGRYARYIDDGEAVFVIREDTADFASGLIVPVLEISRPGGGIQWVTPGQLAPVTDDENLAAAMERTVELGQAFAITSGADLDALLG